MQRNKCSQEPPRKPRVSWLLAGGSLLIFWGLSGCVTRSQQVSFSSTVASPLPQTASSPAVPRPLRGLRGTVPGPSVIVPGKSVGPLQLGDTRERAVELLGEPTEEYTYDENSLGPCKFTEMSWTDLDLDRRGITLYLKNGHIYQIESFTTRFATASGITNDISPQKVRQLYSSLKSYVLLNSGSKVDGGKDLIYWVEDSEGIAFGLYNYPKINKRKTGSIILFERGVKFVPRGCVSPPQEWRELNPFTSELPDSYEHLKPY